MYAGQKMRGTNGKENFLFPLTSLYITQDIGGDFSHRGTYAMDCVEWNGSSQVLKAPYYAPFSCTKIWTLEADGGSVWQSDDVVNTPLGTQVMRILFYHDDAPLPVGTHRNQGDLIGHTGTRGNVTGDHVHIETAVGALSGYQLEQNSYGNWMLKGSTYPYNCLYMNNTTIYVPRGYPWKYAPTTPPPPTINSLINTSNNGRVGNFQGTATAGTGARLKSYSFSARHNGIVDKDIGYISIDQTSGTFNFSFDYSDTAQYIIAFAVIDNYNQRTAKEITVNYVKKNDIIPLYMMNIIQGWYNPT